MSNDQTGDRTTNNFTGRPTWRDNAMVVTMVLNLTFLVGVIFGGMKWVNDVNTSMALLQSRQEAMSQTIKDIQDFDITIRDRHIVEDALCQQAKGVKHR
jgi:Tfp pilus assembly protein PilN